MAHTQRERFKHLAPNFISLSTHFSSPLAELLFVVIIIVLAFTQYNVKEPEIKINVTMEIMALKLMDNAGCIISYMMDADD